MPQWWNGRHEGLDFSKYIFGYVFLFYYICIKLLHRYLEKNWSLLLKNNSSNLENCWNNLRDLLTTTWLETMNVNVIKTTNIGQSAAEPLNEDIIYKFSNEEGSETMY